MTRQLKARILDLENLVLTRGAHKPDGEYCVMEAVAFVAGEPWSDKPKCACPVISTFLRRWNDDLNDTDRQMLKPYIPKLVGTRGSHPLEQRRGWMLADWMIRVHTPAWLQLAGLDDQANILRALPELSSLSQVDQAEPMLSKARESAAAVRAAAGDAVGDAAWAAAGDAAWAAAWAAVRAAEWDEAWAAVRAAAWDAAGAIAGAAAWAAVRVIAGDAATEDAAGAALRPTTEALQASALELLDRLINAR